MSIRESFTHSATTWGGSREKKSCIFFQELTRRCVLLNEERKIKRKTWDPEKEEEGTPPEGGKGRSQDAAMQQDQTVLGRVGDRGGAPLEKCLREKMRPVKSLRNVWRGD